MRLQWWCVAQTTPWDWTWRPFVGVWLFALILVLAWRAVERRWGGVPADTDLEGPGPEVEPDAGGHPWEVAERPLPPALGARGRRIAFLSGVALLWVALDWPVGPLGASYLASVHMVQFVLVGVIAPALLLLGIPDAAFRAFGSTRIFPLIRGATRPLSAFVIFNAAMTATNWPSVVDTLMATQLGSFALDLSWVLGGLILWYPVVVAYPHGERFRPLFKIGYLALNAFLIRPPFAMMIFSRSPIYAVYELAPPLGGVDPLSDQQLGGAIMKIGTAWAMAVGVIAVFYRWKAAELLGERDA